MMLKVENGSFSYQKGVRIFENINFEVGAGEILAILGPNGAGKTTMLRCIMGMLKWQKGHSLLEGESIANMPAKKLWSKMAYVPQAKSVSSAYTAFEMVLLGRSSHMNAFSAPKKEDVQKAEEVMELLGITYLSEKKCSAMSGGELQMVLIARALAAEPQVLILDEPESNLDFKNQLVVLDAMSALAEKGMTCVFNTHYPAHALQRAHKALILSKGGDYVFGDTSKVVTEENIQKAFGVHAIIGEIETKENILRDVVPVRISKESVTGDENLSAKGMDSAKKGAQGHESTRRCIASVTVITNDNNVSDKINHIMHEYSELLIGRMGMPYKECGVYIINVTLDGMEEEIMNFSHKLSLLQGVSVKTTFAKGEFSSLNNRELIDKLNQNHHLERAEWEQLFATFTEEDRSYAAALARQIAIATFGKNIFFRGIIEFTNICKNDCYYCGIRKSNCNVERYRLSLEDIMACCEAGYANGFRTFVLQGGEDGYYNDERMCEIVANIRKKYPDCAITLSLGERSRESYEKLFQAGANRYLLRHETADEVHYGILHPEEMAWENRMRCLRDLKDIGYQTGCGIMVGTPGQTPATLAKDMLFMEELQPEMIGVGPFLPHKDTPFKDKAAGNIPLTLFILALCRIMLPQVLLPSTTALGTANSDGRKQGVLHGCNVIMPNLSPEDVRKSYMLYDNKAGTNLTAQEGIRIVRQEMEEIGYEMVVDRGDFKSA